MKLYKFKLYELLLLVAVLSVAVYRDNSLAFYIKTVTHTMSCGDRFHSIDICSASAMSSSSVISAGAAAAAAVAVEATALPAALTATVAGTGGGTAVLGAGRDSGASLARLAARGEQHSNTR